MISLIKIRELEIDDNFSVRGNTLHRAVQEDKKLGLIPFYVSLSSTLFTYHCFIVSYGSLMVVYFGVGVCHTRYDSRVLL